MRYIEVFKDDAPYIAQVPLQAKTDAGDGTRLYDIEINYNVRHDFFTIGVSYEGADIITGEKLVINRPVKMYCELAPTDVLIPRNRPGQRGDVNYKNMGDTVLLAIERGGNDGALEAETTRRN